MRIDSIEIENFKLFKHENFQFNPEFNLIVGVNGSGKTSLLRAVAVALGGWAYAYVKDKKNLRPILDSEVREIQIDKRFDPAKETMIAAIGETRIIDRFEHECTARIQWTRTRMGEVNSITHSSGRIQYGFSDHSYNLNLKNLAKDILEYIEKGNTFNLPLIAFYECDRLWHSSEKAVSQMEAAEQKYSRFDPYKDGFHTGADDKAISTWILKHELASLQQKRETPVLQAMKHAASAALENCTGIRFDFEESRVMVDFEDEKSIPFEHLSDGQRTIVGLFCDLARRAAILNPHLNGNANSETEGVVLIDELDLHLHPKWQRHVIEDLRKTFPKIQFICSTHSPFLIQSLRSSEEILMLDGTPLLDYANKGIEDIAVNMGVVHPEFSARYDNEKAAAITFLQLLDEMDCSPEDKQEEYKKQLASLLKPFADNPAYQAFLELEYVAKTGEKL